MKKQFSRYAFLLLFAVTPIFFYAQEEGEPIEDEQEEQTDSLSTVTAVQDSAMLDTLNYIDPDSEELYNKALEKLQAESYHEAIALLDESIEISPSFTKAIYNRASAYRLSKQYDKAVRDYDAVLKKDSLNHAGFFNRGLSKIELGQENEGLQDILHADKIDEDGNNYSYDLAIIYMKEGNNEKARSILDLSINSGSAGALAFHDRGSLKMMDDDIEGAISDYEKAIKTDPGNPLFYANLGTAKRKLKDYTGAIGAYNQSLLLESGNAIVLNNLGYTKFLKGDFEDAIKDFDKAIKAKSDYAYAYNNKASALIKLEKFEEAEKACDKAIQFDKEYAYAYLNRGIAREMLRKEDDACKDWHEASRLGVNNAQSYIEYVCQ